MNPQSRPASRKIIWIAAGAGVVLLLCGCAAAAVTLLGSTLFLFGPGSGSQPVSYGTPTPVPVSLGSWQPLPDLPRKINTLVADPTNPKILYAGTGLYGEGGTGLYKSVDGGVTWTLSVNGLPDDMVVALGISHDASVLYANVGPDTAMYASTDGAQSWHAVGKDEALCCNVDRHIVVRPDHPQQLFVVQSAADENLSYSADGGQTWQRIPDDRQELKPAYLAIDPLNPQIVYLGSLAHGAYKSTDGGQTWAPANRGMVDYAIQSLAISSADDQIIYAGSSVGKIFKTTNGGQSWAEVSGRLPVEDYARGEVVQLVLDPQAPDTVYALLATAGLLRSNDAGATWARVAMPSVAAGQRFMPQSTMVMTFQPRLQVVLGLYYPDGNTSGAWRCAP